MFLGVIEMRILMCALIIVSLLPLVYAANNCPNFQAGDPCYSRSLGCLDEYGTYPTNSETYGQTFDDCSNDDCRRCASGYVATNSGTCVLAVAHYTDYDEDGFGSTGTCRFPAGEPLVPGVSDVNTDCNDATNFINPDVDEVCSSAVDHDCSGDPYNGCYDYYPDYDEDGASSLSAPAIRSSDVGETEVFSIDGEDILHRRLVIGASPTPDDCDDEIPGVNPFLEEVCGDFLDNNCNGEVDEATSCPSYNQYTLYDHVFLNGYLFINFYGATHFDFGVATGGSNPPFAPIKIITTSVGDRP